jgi:hypothetical protein
MLLALEVTLKGLRSATESGIPDDNALVFSELFYGLTFW